MFKLSGIRPNYSDSKLTNKNDWKNVSKTIYRYSWTLISLLNVNIKQKLLTYDLIDRNKLVIWGEVRWWAQYEKEKEKVTTKQRGTNVQLREGGREFLCVFAWSEGGELQQICVPLTLFSLIIKHFSLTTGRLFTSADWQL